MPGPALTPLTTEGEGAAGAGQARGVQDPGGGWSHILQHLAAPEALQADGPGARVDGAGHQGGVGEDHLDDGAILDQYYW